MARRSTTQEGFGRLAAALASGDAVAPQIEDRLVRLTITTRWVTILAGVLFGVLRHSSDHFVAVSIVLVTFATVMSFQRTHKPSTRIRLLVVLELVLTVTASTVTGGIASPFVLTPVTGLLLAGYVWGRRAAIGTAISGLIAAAATLTMQAFDATDQRGSRSDRRCLFALWCARCVFPQLDQ